MCQTFSITEAIATYNIPAWLANGNPLLQTYTMSVFNNSTGIFSIITNILFVVYSCSIIIALSYFLVALVYA